MLKSLILRRLSVQEKSLGASLDYVRHMLNVSFGAFRRFALIQPMAGYRRVLPADAYHVARLVATQNADCGSCVQIEVNLARRDGVEPSILQAVLNDELDALPQELADVCRFTNAVVTARDDEPLREAVRARFGETGLVELALAIASSQVFPTVKRTLGYARSCSLFTVDIP